MEHFFKTTNHNNKLEENWNWLVQRKTRKQNYSRQRWQKDIVELGGLCHHCLMQSCNNAAEEKNSFPQYNSGRSWLLFPLHQNFHYRCILKKVLLLIQAVPQQRNTVGSRAPRLGENPINSDRQNSVAKSCQADINWLFFFFISFYFFL